MKNVYQVNDIKKKEETPTPPVNENLEAGKFRTVLPQVLASTIKNFLLLDLGLSVAFPTIVIPALTGLNSGVNPNEIIKLTAIQASWLGSIAYIFEPLGSVLSGLISEPIGRKKAMFFVNIPHLIAWTMLYYASSLTEVFVAHILLGLGVGLMEAPIITYVGEICQKSIRGILIALSGIAATLGLFIVFLLGSLTEWRNVALYCLSVPVITMIVVCFIPETPLWLLSKNREADALKSLQWLRGWVSAKAVKEEFDEIKRYNEYSVSCSACIKAERRCTHPPPTIRQKLQELIRRRTIKPFIILLTAFFIGQFSGTHAMRPYIVQILRSFGTPISPNWATVLLGLTGIIGTMTCVLTVKFIGKRRLYLGALSIICLSGMGLGIYGFCYLPMGWTSFNRKPDEIIPIEPSYFPLSMFVLMGFGTSVGVSAVPWMLLSELFPFKSRGFATGLTAAVNYVMQFIATKTYYNLEKLLSLPGITCLYGVIGIIGWITMYLLLPETEDRTLEDIEVHFSDNHRKITDRKIQKNMSVKSFDIPSDLVATIENERKLKELTEAKENLKNSTMNDQIKSYKEHTNELKSENSFKQNNHDINGHTNKAFIDDKN